MIHVRARPVVLVVVALVTLLPVTLAHSGHDSLEYSEQDIRATFGIAGFQMAELNFDAGEGEVIRWSVATDAKTPPYVDIHAHDDNGTVTFFADNGNHTIDQEFVVPKDGEYSILVRNEQTTGAEFTLTAQGWFAVISTHGFEVQSEGRAPLSMAIPLVALAALVLAAVLGRRRNG